MTSNYFTGSLYSCLSRSTHLIHPEQTATISEITGNITRMSDVVQRTARGSLDSSVAAAQLASLSDDLSTLVTQFKVS